MVSPWGKACTGPLSPVLAMSYESVIISKERVKEDKISVPPQAQALPPHPPSSILGTPGDIYTGWLPLHWETCRQPSTMDQWPALPGLEGTGTPTHTPSTLPSVSMLHQILSHDPVCFQCDPCYNKRKCYLEPLSLTRTASQESSVWGDGSWRLDAGALPCGAIPSHLRGGIFPCTILSQRGQFHLSVRPQAASRRASGFR